MTLKISQMVPVEVPAPHAMFPFVYIGDPRNYRARLVDIPMPPFQQEGAGSVPRSFNTKVSEWVSVYDYLTDAMVASVEAGNLLVDTLPAFNSARDELALRGGGDLIVPPGSYALTDTLTINSPSIRLRGMGDDFYRITGSDRPSTRFVRTGPSTNPVVLLTSVSGAANPKLSGMDFQDIGIDGNGVAVGGLLLQSVNDCHIRTTIQGCTSYQFKTATVAALIDARDVQHCFFEYIRVIAAGSADGIVFDAGSAGANTSFNKMGLLYVTHTNGNAVVFANADNNQTEFIQVARVAGGTGVGLRLKAGTSPEYCRANVFNVVSPGPGGTLAEGTPSGTTASSHNFILYLDKENAAPDPVIETGASLYWGSNRGISGLWGAFKIALGDSHSSAVNARTAMGLETMRIRNGSGLHVVFDNPAGETWSESIDPATGDFRLNRVAGTGMFVLQTTGIAAAAAQLSQQTISSNTSLTNASTVALVNASGGNVVVTLPLANTYKAGRTGVLQIRRIDASGNTVTVQRQGADGLNGGTSETLAANAGKTYVCDSAAAWYSF